MGIVIDDSRSMRITDYGGEGAQPRSDFVQEVFGGPDSDLISALSERFKLRYFRFSDNADRLAELEALTFGGEQTHLGGALEFAQQELAAVPLAGIVVVTDGADNSIEGLFRIFADAARQLGTGFPPSASVPSASTAISRSPASRRRATC